MYLPLLLLALPIAAYDLVQDYSGTSFFDLWDFYGAQDNLTQGNVYYLDRDDAFSQGLAYYNEFNRSIMKVDNTSWVGDGGVRGSIRITTQESFAVGSLFLMDAVHVPWGCSVWPAFWTMGELWPDDGEIDILEAINLMAANQMALHTTAGCLKAVADNQEGTTLGTDCSTAAGCTVLEAKNDSFGWGLNYGSTWVGGDAASGGMGGGVWACQFDVQGIFIWFWPRPSIPQSIIGSTSTSGVDMSDWGNPSASYPNSGCDIDTYFGVQKIVMDITLCGQWAGLSQDYLPQCSSSGNTGNCYLDCVVGSGSRFSEAYFEVNYVRAYTTGGVAPTPTGPNLVQHISTTQFTTSVSTQTQLVQESPMFWPASAPASSVKLGNTSLRGWLILSLVMVLSAFSGMWVVLL